MLRPRPCREVLAAPAATSCHPPGAMGCNCDLKPTAEGCLRTAMLTGLGCTAIAALGLTPAGTVDAAMPAGLICASTKARGLVTTTLARELSGLAVDVLGGARARGGDWALRELKPWPLQLVKVPTASVSAAALGYCSEGVLTPTPRLNDRIVPCLPRTVRSMLTSLVNNLCDIDSVAGETGPRVGIAAAAACIEVGVAAASENDGLTRSSEKGYSLMGPCLGCSTETDSQESLLRTMLPQVPSGGKDEGTIPPSCATRAGAVDMCIGMTVLSSLPPACVAGDLTGGSLCNSLSLDPTSAAEEEPPCDISPCCCCVTSARKTKSDCKEFESRCASSLHAALGRRGTALLLLLFVASNMEVNIESGNISRRLFSIAAVAPSSRVLAASIA